LAASTTEVFVAWTRVGRLMIASHQDHRLLAGGPLLPATFAHRIASSRYLSAVATPSLEATWQAPVVAATGSSKLTKHQAMLTATVDPSDSPTAVEIEYGRSTAYGSTTQSIDGVGQGPVTVTVELDGQPSGTTLHYRAVAENLGGAASGADQTLTTVRNQAPDVLGAWPTHVRTGLRPAAGHGNTARRSSTRSPPAVKSQDVV
jgi:hypothetical protein